METHIPLIANRHRFEPSTLVSKLDRRAAHPSQGRIWIPKSTHPEHKRHNTLDVLGIGISILSAGQFLRHVRESLSRGARGAAASFIATVNPEFVMMAKEDPAFRKILERTTVNTADGNGICKALKIAYGVDQERITGSDSMAEICRLSAECSRSVFLLGAAPGIAEEAAEVLRRRIPGLKINGTHAPGNRTDGVSEYPDEVRERLIASDVVFVALGAPHQEFWIRNNLESLPNCRLAIGVGGTFDFIAGRVERAPEWMRHAGLEWLHRLLIQPSRWRRMLKLPMFLWQVLATYGLGASLSTNARS